MKTSILIARFPYGGIEHPDIADWLVRTVPVIKADRRVSAVYNACLNDTPITMTRNRVLKRALDDGIDYVLMIDSDMKPDLYPQAPTFWDHAWSFAQQHRGPLCIAAPYAGPPPDECVYVFHWTKKQEKNPNPDLKLSMFSREHSAGKSGIEEVAALPTGLILIDMRALTYIKPPWFRYEWTDVYEQAKASTEDVYFTRNLSLAGVPQYVTWDCWAGHHKHKLVERPTVLKPEFVAETLRDSIVRRFDTNGEVHEPAVPLPGDAVRSH